MSKIKIFDKYKYLGVELSDEGKDLLEIKKR